MKNMDLGAIQKKVNRAIGRIAGNRLLLTLRDTFIMASTPIMIAGFAIMIGSVFLDPTGIIFGKQGLQLGKLFTGSPSDKAWLATGFAAVLTRLQKAVGLFSNGTMAINALFVIAGFAYFGTKRFFRKNKEPILVSFYALAAFFIVVPWSVTGATAAGKTHTLVGILDSQYIGQPGMFAGLVVAGVTFWLFNKIVEKNITIKLPDSVPPAVAHSFEALIPGGIVLILAVVVASVFSAYNTSLPAAMLAVLQKPMLAISTTPYFAFFAMVGQPILGWFGIHGSSIFGPIFGLTWDINQNENIMGTAHHMISTLFMNFTVINTGGLCAGAIIAVLIVSHREDRRALAKLAIPPVIFNIGEPVMFGFPIVLNPYLLLPWILCYTIPFYLGIFFTKIGFLPIITNAVPWTMPPLISGFLYTGNINGTIFQALMLALCTLIWIPFIKMWDSSEKDATIKATAQ
ncbi:PTS sugar transporter subunit IIC [Lacticaseibacillus camelliae]|nr:PTS transporter subunit EIIC [Lacticaseibacillus camelliae]